MLITLSSQVAVAVADILAVAVGPVDIAHLPELLGAAHLLKPRLLYSKIMPIELRLALEVLEVATHLQHQLQVLAPTLFLVQ